MPAAQTHRIAKEDVLEFVVKDILHQRSADSQKELAELINRKFAASGSSFRVSPERARLAALGIGAKVVIRTKMGGAPVKCPGCGRRLKKKYMRNLKGKALIFSMRCSYCGYEGRLGKWVPSRYGFARL